MALTLFSNALFFRHDRWARGSLLVDGEKIVEFIPAGDREPAVADAIDMGGGYVIPGFVDSHFHLLALGLKSMRCDLSRAASALDAVRLLSEWVADHPGDSPVVGVDWDESTWENPEPLTRRMLDSINDERALFARRICGHVGVVNTAFLGLLAGNGDFIDRDSGRVTEAAAFEATRLGMPPREDMEASVDGAFRALHRLGVTGIHDIVSAHTLDVYLAGVAAARVPLRIEALFDAPTSEWEAIERACASLDPGRFHALGIKRFADGSIGGRTAALHSSYADGQTLGDFLLDETELADDLKFCCERGITCAVHAIGDRALRAVLLAMLDATGEHGLFRIEHAELIGHDELKLLTKAPVHLAVQPNFVRNWQHPGGLYEARLGKPRWRRCNPFRTLAAAGVEYMFGSDGMPPGPLYGILGATQHPVEEERIGPADAIERYTTAPDRLGRVRGGAGRLESGRLADFVALSGDPFDGRLDKAAVTRTVVGGEVVFDGAGDGFDVA
jgi:predicted amidohydrolase YtcJ